MPRVALVRGIRPRQLGIRGLQHGRRPFRMAAASHLVVLLVFRPTGDTCSWGSHELKTWATDEIGPFTSFACCMFPNVPEQAFHKVHEAGGKRCLGTASRINAAESARGNSKPQGLVTARDQLASAGALPAERPCGERLARAVQCPLKKGTVSLPTPRAQPTTDGMRVQSTAMPSCVRVMSKCWRHI